MEFVCLHPMVYDFIWVADDIVFFTYCQSSYDVASGMEFRHALAGGIWDMKGVVCFWVYSEFV